jgi:hypothetical protein
MRPKSWKSLLLKARHLDLEVEDHRDLLKEHTLEFDRLVREAAGEPPPEPSPPPPEASDDPHGLVPFVEPEEAVPNTGAPAQPPEPEIDCPEAVRKLWRAIATATHPDKTRNDPELTALYKEAAEAWSEGAFEKLIDIAVELGIPIPMDEGLVPYIQKRADRLQTEVQEIESLAIWQWIQASEKERARIIQHTARVYQHRKAQRGK